ncbi:cytochrome c oxidase subunit 4 [Pseudonocardia acaciae]|uniref:cytochrome c oxidase subunit 4 n=1 Tax=Pseudonocardia acaciae TaxID=551276 RepID=UPI00048F1AA3|nr:cytochrome c oxidase subunit 4 [Pseudonocardia acaciae]
MKVESRIFEICTVFFFVCAVVYWLLSYEPVGIVGLTLTGGLSLIIGTYFRFVSRRLEGRPEDNPEAEVADGAGDMGFFSPGSYWPIGVAFAVAMAGVSVAYWLPWAIVISGVVLLIMVGGLLFEYHLPPSGH